MAGEWKRVAVSEVCDLIVDCVNKTAPVVEELTPFKMLRTTNIKSGRIDRANCRRVSKETFVKWTRRADVRQGDVLLTREAPLGEVGYVDFIDTVFLGQRIMQYRANRALLDPRFLLYTFLSKELQNQFGAHEGSGSTVSHIRVGDCSRFQIPLPPLPEQKAIAAVLGALDDKIELNRRMNATLEAMARALFQSWFIDFDPVRQNMDRKQNQPSTRPTGHPSLTGRRDGDEGASGLDFDPVRAKLDGRQPIGMDKATAALFPDSFQDSALGPIPKGWRATTLGGECERGGGNIQTGPFGTQLHASDYVDEGVPSIMPSDLRDNRIEISEIARIRESDAKRLSMYRVQPGDVVYSRRGDVERRSLIRHEEAGWLCGTGCLRVRFGPNGLNPFFGASYLGSEDSRAWVVRHAVGATMPNLNTSILGALPMIVPPPELQARFAEIVGPLDDRGTIALNRSRTLATLRDTLLPKLLSGELNVAALDEAGVSV